MDGESLFVAVVSVVADPVTDGLIDAINAMLSEGQWEQVAVLALSLREHALAVGDGQLAVLVEDIRAIAWMRWLIHQGMMESFGVVVLVGGTSRGEVVGRVWARCISRSYTVSARRSGCWRCWRIGLTGMPTD